ncbi:MAG: hypothetical protein ACRC4T_11720 [Cetobacterium sp.]
MIRTNAVDSFVIDNIGVGNGEAKLYLRRNLSDTYYRNYFKIDSLRYGTTTTRSGNKIRYRDNGPSNNCYYTKKSIQNYIKEQQSNQNLTESQKAKLRNFNLNSLEEKNYFGVNYVFDSQERSYIGSLNDNFDILRYLSISTETIVNMEKNEENNEIEFSLSAGQL